MSNALIERGSGGIGTVVLAAVCVASLLDHSVEGLRGRKAAGAKRRRDPLMSPLGAVSGFFQTDVPCAED